MKVVVTVTPENYFRTTLMLLVNNWVANGLTRRNCRISNCICNSSQMKKAVTNQLYFKDLTITAGDAIYGNSNSPQENLPSGNPGACADVQTQIDTLGAIVTQIINDENLR